MRQYCSGGSRIWSSIQPLLGVCSSGWLRKNRNRPPGAQHPGHLGDGVVDVADVLEHQAGHDGVERRRRANGSARGARRGRSAGPPPRSAATTTCAHVGSTPDDRASRRRPTASRATCPSPQPTSSTRARAGEVLGGQRQDLLLVLRVGAVGEPVLPPAGVRPPTGPRRRASSGRRSSAAGLRGSCRRRPRPPRRAATSAPGAPRASPASPR